MDLEGQGGKSRQSFQPYMSRHVLTVWLLCLSYGEFSD